MSMIMSHYRENVEVPHGLTTLDLFRKWARSPEFPSDGHFSFIDGHLYVDLSVEQLFTHNGVKTAFTGKVSGIVESDENGYYFSDRALVTNEDAGFSTELDGMYVSYESIHSGRVRLVEGADEGFVEVEGSPDMTLEIVSSWSVEKDTVILRDAYWRAGIKEYWLVDARAEETQFSILKRGNRGYTATRKLAGGWQYSDVFERYFLLLRKVDRLRNPRFELKVKS